MKTYGVLYILEYIRMTVVKRGYNLNRLHTSLTVVTNSKNQQEKNKRHLQDCILM